MCIAFNGVQHFGINPESLADGFCAANDEASGTEAIAVSAGYTQIKLLSFMNWSQIDDRALKDSRVCTLIVLDCVFGTDMSASSAKTQERLGWHPNGSQLIADLHQFQHAKL